MDDYSVEGELNVDLAADAQSVCRKLADQTEIALHPVRAGCNKTQRAIVTLCHVSKSKVVHDGSSDEI